MLKVSGETSMYMYRPDQANINATSNCGNAYIVLLSLSSVQ